MRLGWQELTLDLAEPFVSNKGTTASVRQVLVRLEWNGLVGWGTALPERGASWQEVFERCAPLLRESSPFAWESLLDACEAAALGHWAAISGIDMALFDLLGKATGRPLHELWGLSGRTLPPTGRSIGQMTEAERVARARELAAWPILKLKMTADADLGVVARLREVYSGRIWIDGNGAWDVPQAIEAAHFFHRHGVELLEQPVAPGRIDALKKVYENSPILIVADEDCRRPEDVIALRGAVGGVNIKLLKCGGLRRAAEMIRLARGFGLRVMLGCKAESALGITAIAQLGGLADYLDLDGHLLFAHDPFRGLTVREGQLQLPLAPGIGARHEREA